MHCLVCFTLFKELAPKVPDILLRVDMIENINIICSTINALNRTVLAFLLKEKAHVVLLYLFMFLLLLLF